MDQTPAPVPPASQPPVKPLESAGSTFFGELFEFAWETVRVVLISLVIILPVRYYLIQPFFVKGSSMVPNFHDKEYVLVDKWTYRLGQPERGDVIIFRYPGNPKEYFIKRVIGLPGESVLVGNDNTVTVFNERYPNGFKVAEAGYLPRENPTYCSGTSAWCGTKVLLEPNHYFVMGDNREHSSDSRFFGPVDRSYFAGLAWLRLWPLNKISFIPRTEYPPVVQ
ncbi:MAG: signal peptidase I [Candidatus Yanofskybacteria bacterium]|nr:signal peptidase I [Candidatus Yanofskybacteria bacterium]